MSSEPPDEFDLFVSYAHTDDQDGSVSALVDTIEQDHRKFTSEPLKVFFDRKSIQCMDDWESRILKGLHQSKLMLAVLSPAYFQSEYCRLEWEEYLRHELGQKMPGESIAPIYVATDEDFEQHAEEALNEWKRNLKRRQYVDVRNWWVEGPRALERQDVRQRLQDLEGGVRARLERLARMRASPTTVPDRTAKFVGRRDEIEQIRRTLAYGRVGAIAAVHGIGGVGKSALAFHYAHAYAEQYPGGRYLVPCEGLTDLRDALLKLVPQLGIKLSDAESKDIDAAIARLKSELNKCQQMLVVLDNVDDERLLAPEACSLHLPNHSLVHVLATTRLAPDLLPDTDVLALDALSESSALELMAKHRPIAEDQWHAAQQIVRRLGGHSLAVEVVAVFLKHYDEVSYEAYLTRLEKEGLEAVEGASRDAPSRVTRKSERIIGQLLKPTLEAVSEAELLVIELASLLPPDCIAVPWLREVAAETLPELAGPSQDGHPDRWKNLMRRLTGLRMLTPVDDQETTYRMHRLVQDVVTARLGSRREELAEQLHEYLKCRSQRIRKVWVEQESRWEVTPLLVFASHVAQQHPQLAAFLANRLTEPLRQLGRYAEGRRLLLDAIKHLGAVDPGNESLGKAHSNLALIELSLGNPDEARHLMQRAIEILEQLHGSDSPVTAALCLNLGNVQNELGCFAEARTLLERAIRIWKKQEQRDYRSLMIAYSLLARIERIESNHPRARKLGAQVIAVAERLYGEQHPEVAANCAELASVEHQLANFAEARKLYARAAEIREQVFRPDHPKLAKSFESLASLERTLANYDEALRLYHLTREIRESVFDENHPILADSYGDLASLAQELARYDEARQYQQQALEIRRQALAEDHPVLAKSYSGLGSLERELANFDAARRWLEWALQIRNDRFGQDHPIVAGSMSSLASLELTLDNVNVARQMQERALAIREACFDPHHPTRASSYSAMAGFAQRAGDYKQARLLHRRALAIREEIFPADHPVLAGSYAGLASLELAEGNLEASQELQQRALDIRAAVFEDDHPLLASCYAGMAKLRSKQGQLIVAKALLQRAAEIDRQAYGDDHPSLARDYARLANVEAKLEHMEPACRLMRLAWQIRSDKFGPGHSQTRESSRWLATHDRDFRGTE